MLKLYSGTKDRSIVGIGYHLFEKLAGENRKEDHAEKFRKILLEMPSILTVMQPLRCLPSFISSVLLHHKLENLLFSILIPIKKLLERISRNVFEKVHLISLISTQPSLLAEHEEFPD
ncbi:hypothetical protein M9H77_28304 [Catharanthus roseus]|uniref:Uncharacterized protein n=1 Tax=Catharanthus roseus TaxID=4058 RepID=A0ACC0AFZ7_CATRO|nr:hypothetical protein M9H77_28304 [Catharanthus roseus]